MKDLKKKIEEVIDNFYKSKHGHIVVSDVKGKIYVNDIFLNQILSLFQEENKKLVEKIKGMKIRHITNSKYPMSKEDEQWQIDTQREIDWFNNKLDGVIELLSQPKKEE